MKLNFNYNQEKDAWCILNFGKGSNNSNYTTEMYNKLAQKNILSQTEAENFVNQYIKENNYSSEKCIKNYTEIFESIKDEYVKIAEKVFKVKIDYEINAYLTLNERYPYGIEEKLFFVPFSLNPNNVSNMVIMHELWHFYTWQRFGEKVESEIGPEKYNIVKESLTVLLNLECKHLFPEGKIDKGYPQHKDLREVIIKMWNEKPDIDYIWNEAVKFLDNI